MLAHKTSEGYQRLGLEPRTERGVQVHPAQPGCLQRVDHVGRGKTPNEFVARLPVLTLIKKHLVAVGSYSDLNAIGVVLVQPPHGRAQRLLFGKGIE